MSCKNSVVHVNFNQWEKRTMYFWVSTLDRWKTEPNPMADFTETVMILSWFFQDLEFLIICIYVCIYFFFFSIKDLFYILRSVHFILCILCPKKKNVKTWEKSLIQTLCFDQSYLKRCLLEMKSHTFQQMVSTETLSIF